ncbi:MAG: response regulator [Pseudomonadota bacterium]
MTARARILIVDDEAAHVRALCDTLRAQGFETVGCDNAQDALEVLGESRFELLLADLMMPGTDGITLVQAARNIDPDLACIIMTGEGSIASAVQAMKVGALDYILKPCKLSAVLPVLARALETRQLRIGNARLEGQLREHAAELAALNLDLDQARREAERSNHAKSVFLATMSHELRTPLNAILGFAQILNSETLPSTAEQKKGFARHILQAGKHLLTLINEVLDLARVESGSLTMSIEPVALGPVLLECEALIVPLAERRGIALRFPEAVEAQLMCDRMRLKQVMINLLSNAVKYNREAGSVTVHWQVDGGGRVRIGVRDTGAGMAPDQLAQLFQPFNRLGRDAGIEEGTGIGLALTRHLVELMGGVIGVESMVEVGSTFWIEFDACPLAELPQGALPAGAAADGVPVRRSRSRHTLLYIEDNPANLKLVEEIIRPRADLQLLSAPDGQHGIELARKHLPQLILVDINLPGFDGYEIQRILRADPRTAQIPVIAVSASAMAGEVRRGFDAGFYRYITKPIDIDVFTAAIDSALKLTAMRQGN